MDNHAYSEIRLFNQILLGLVITAIYGYFLFVSTMPFPSIAFIGTTIGLVIILICWIGKRSILFIFGLIAATVIYSIMFGWNHLF